MHLHLQFTRTVAALSIFFTSGRCVVSYFGPVQLKLQHGGEFSLVSCFIFVVLKILLPVISYTLVTVRNVVSLHWMFRLWSGASRQNLHQAMEMGRGQHWDYLRQLCLWVCLLHLRHIELPRMNKLGALCLPARQCSMSVCPEHSLAGRLVSRIIFPLQIKLFQATATNVLALLLV